MKRKTIKDYERGAHWEEECLIYPTYSEKDGQVARRIYQLRHQVKLSSIQFVCHTCDHPQCIRDKHHWLGSNSKNILDSYQKGRSHPRVPKGGINIEARKYWASKRGRLHKQRMKGNQLWKLRKPNVH